MVLVLVVLLGVPAAADQRGSDDIRDELSGSEDRARRASEQLEVLRGEIGTQRTELVEIEQRLAEARGRLRHAEGQVDLGEKALRDAREREATAQENLAEAQRLLARTERELEREEEVLANQIVESYKYGSSHQVALVLTMIRESREPGELARSMRQFGAILEHQDGIVDEVVELRRERLELRSETRERRQAAADRRADAADTLETVERLRADAQALADEVAADEARQREVVASLESDASAQESVLREARATSDQLSDDLAAAEAREERERQEAATAATRTTSDMVCPVVGAVAGQDFTDDWGYPRSGGRRHEGNDIFADRGTPVVAVADATVREVNRADSGLGGLTVSYTVSDGSYWYMAHLDSVAGDIAPGTRVSQGQQVGTNGNSGNARGTPPHTHVGHYYGEGNPVNPYPDLEAACR